jgi:hypothetical protein
MAAVSGAIPLAMVVIDDFPEGAPKVALAGEHHPIEALVLDGPMIAQWAVGPGQRAADLAHEQIIGTR